MFQHYNLLSFLQVPELKLVEFVRAVEAEYHPNPYHNFDHGFDVMQTCFSFAKRFRADELLTQADILVLLIGALGHDVDHPGLTNDFLVKTRDRLALLYNDKSVLENHHIAKLFEIIDRHGLFVHLSDNDYKLVRKKLIDSVLYTDMSRHFQIMDQLNAFTLEFDMQTTHTISRSKLQLNEDNRQLLISVLLHNADISNPVKPWPICKKWSDLVCDEFFRQGDIEKAKGLPVSPNMDRETTVQAQMACGFADYIIEPSYSALCRILPLTKECYDVLRDNRTKWGDLKRLHKEGIAAKEAASPAGAVSASSSDRFASKLSSRRSGSSTNGNGLSIKQRLQQQQQRERQKAASSHSRTPSVDVAASGSASSSPSSSGRAASVVIHAGSAIAETVAGIAAGSRRMSLAPGTIEIPETFSKKSKWFRSRRNSHRKSLRNSGSIDTLHPTDASHTNSELLSIAENRSGATSQSPTPLLRSRAGSVSDTSSSNALACLAGSDPCTAAAVAATTVGQLLTNASAQQVPPSTTKRSSQRAGLRWIASAASTVLFFTTLLAIFWPVLLEWFIPAPEAVSANSYGMQRSAFGQLGKPGETAVSENVSTPASSTTTPTVTFREALVNSLSQFTTPVLSQLLHNHISAQLLSSDTTVLGSVFLAAVLAAVLGAVWHFVAALRQGRVGRSLVEATALVAMVGFDIPFLVALVLGYTPGTLRNPLGAIAALSFAPIGTTSLGVALMLLRCLVLARYFGTFATPSSASSSSSSSQGKPSRQPFGVRVAQSTLVRAVCVTVVLLLVHSIALSAMVGSHQSPEVQFLNGAGSIHTALNERMQFMNALAHAQLADEIRRFRVDYPEVCFLSVHGVVAFDNRSPVRTVDLLPVTFPSLRSFVDQRSLGVTLDTCKPSLRAGSSQSTPAWEAASKPFVAVAVDVGAIVRETMAVNLQLALFTFFALAVFSKLVEREARRHFATSVAELFYPLRAFGSVFAHLGSLLDPTGGKETQLAATLTQLAQSANSDATDLLDAAAVSADNLSFFANSKVAELADLPESAAGARATSVGPLLQAPLPSLRLADVQRLGSSKSASNALQTEAQQFVNERGVKLTAIFGYCNIRRFTIATDILQEDVIVLANGLAHLVRVACPGAENFPNKNVGDAFLLVWKKLDRLSASIPARVSSGGALLESPASSPRNSSYMGDSEGSIGGLLSSKFTGTPRPGTPVPIILERLGSQHQSPQARGITSSESVSGASDGASSQAAAAVQPPAPISSKHASASGLFSGDASPVVDPHVILLPESDDDGKPVATTPADEALASFVNIVEELECLNCGELEDSLLFDESHFEFVRRVRRDVPGYAVQMGFGLHRGWAIEGRIGADDDSGSRNTGAASGLSYLSPHVNIASRLEAATKAYGVEILLSGEAFMLLSPAYQAMCRQIDRVSVKGSKWPIDLYTYDFNTYEHGSDWERAFGGIKSDTTPSGSASRSASPSPLANGSPDGSSESTSSATADFAAISRYRTTFHQGVQAYIQGNWTKATDILNICSSMYPNDRPAQTLLSFIAKYDHVSPPNWAGCRPLPE
ncbi:phosphodiesterase 1B [Capsaspora owczarzaki ATCC 30864]|uniref:Phosphodiesterase n=1 Tax=Capsaspora owczarzaki (strain ATCC 30864) TaxID=595528 RepID=A0A0D2VRD3_CAPO3|nr:phosphodiesterase 1B [Capsaspora owczarzaki ATCC 30864]KJE93417.1 phosphodiesterase 1B [Capsaspora owczarzaki ATCC 30864]|eukprot:XP_004348035.2 phosphodiesterase 1B [Capsaspora owczarzaki ATCC 30864]